MEDKENNIKDVISEALQPISDDFKTKDVRDLMGHTGFSRTFLLNIAKGKFTDMGLEAYLTLKSYPYRHKDRSGEEARSLMKVIVDKLNTMDRRKEPNLFNLAKIIGISKPTMYYIAAGHLTNPRLSIYLRLKNDFGV